MRPFLQRGWFCLVLTAFYVSSYCDGIKLEGRASPYSNTTLTTKFSPSSTPIAEVDLALITPTATFSASSTQNYSSTITSAPALPWGNQSIPVNTCSVTATDGSIQWTPCAIFAGTLQLSFFPSAKGNVSYPPTMWNSDWSVMMTSPSLYMVVNTLTGENDCGPLGPTFKNKVISMDLTDLSTLQPYADHTVTTRMGPPQQLTLSDLTSNCLDTYTSFSTDGAYVNTHPVYGNYNRCRPRFVFPIQLKRIGYPYWMHCGPYNYTYGVFDPPGAVPPVSGLLPTTLASPYTSTYDTPSALPTTTPVAETSPPAAAPTKSTPPIDPTAAPSKPAGNPPGSPAAPTKPANPPSKPSDPPVITPSIPLQTSATAIATVGSETISAIPGSTGVVLPGGSTVQPGGVATVTDSNSKPVVISVGFAGVYIGGTSEGDSTTFVSNPTIPPIAIATVGSEIISAAPGATYVVVGSQTASLGGAPITVSGGTVVLLTPSGVVVNDNSGGASVVYAIPTLSNNNVALLPSPIATVGGQLISAAPGDSTVVINGQVVTSGGAAVTLAGTNVVASLGAGGLVLQYPSGSVSTYALPTPAPKAAGIVGPLIGTVDGIAFSASAGASVIAIGSQAVKLGGSVITVGSDVVSFGLNGLVVQMPSGGLTTLSAHADSTAKGTLGSVSSMGKISSSITGSDFSAASASGGIAEMIASIAGATKTGGGSGSPASVLGSSSPAAVTTSGGSRVEIGGGVVLIFAAVCGGAGMVVGM